MGECMKIKPFGVEIWMNRHENDCRYNLGETCVESLTVAGLLELAGKGNSGLDDVLPLRLTYGAIEGSERLRTAIAALYRNVAPHDIIAAHGAIGANALVYQALVEPGDRVVAIMPNYQQHHSIPEALGADVRSLRLRPQDRWLPDPDELRALAGGKARIIALSNPNNPTGALLDEAALGEIVRIADECGAWVLCDEVYRGLEHDGRETAPSIVDLYDRGIAVGSMSKAFSLAGLRLGWIAAPRSVIEAVTIHRDYNTISVGMVDDMLAAIALEARERVLERSRTIAGGNRAVLSRWIDEQPSIEWEKPDAGTIALLRFAHDMPSQAFCERLLAETGVLLTPGSAFDVEGTARIGYANNPAVLADGLAAMSGFLAGLDREAGLRSR